MSTLIRPELSEKNKYWIEKHRYYELKHFCLQYYVWRTEYEALESSVKASALDRLNKSNKTSDPTAECAEKREYYSNRMKIVEQTAEKTDSDLSLYIFKAVTEGFTYTVLKLKHNVPCCRDVFYDRYRKFFWLLDEVRG